MTDQPEPVHGCTIGGQPAVPILVSEYNRLVSHADPELHNQLQAAITALGKAETELAALRQVARGYCPACGRGDAAPSVTDWEQQKQRADQAEDLLRIAHDTSNKSEAARAQAVERADQLAAILDEVLRHFVHKGHPGEPCLQTGWISEKTVTRWRNVLHQPQPATPEPGLYEKIVDLFGGPLPWPPSCSCGLMTQLIHIDAEGQHWHKAGEHGEVATTGVIPAPASAATQATPHKEQP